MFVQSDMVLLVQGVTCLIKCFDNIYKPFAF